MNLYLPTHHGNGTKRGTGRTDHDATPSHPMAHSVAELTRCLVI